MTANFLSLSNDEQSIDLYNITLSNTNSQIKKTIDSSCTHIEISDEDNFGNTSCSTEMTNNLNIHPLNFQNNSTPKGVNAIKSSLILSSSKKERDIIIGDDPWIEVCKAILEIIHANPDAASERESRHGCMNPMRRLGQLLVYFLHFLKLRSL